MPIRPHALLGCALSLALASAATAAPLFSPYKDIAISMNWNNNVMSSNVSGVFQPLLSVLPPRVPAVTWAFATGECGAETWAGLDPDALAQANVPLFVKRKVGYIISTGGAAGKFTCSSAAGMRAFIDRYASPRLLGLDFDIEAGQSAAEINSLVDQLAAVQADYPGLRYSFTLATLGSSTGQVSSLPYGDLNITGYTVIQAIQRAGLANYTLNLMVMDYGGPSPWVCVVAKGHCDMGRTAIQAAQNLNAKFGIPYAQIELTPMIGRNDVVDEVFSLKDANTMIGWAKANGLAGVHFWSFDRDTPCALPYASATCSSVADVPALAYTKRFRNQVAAP
ncbi:hypothetical protein SAMN02949497_2268 [Methylomagnum ishizawai]|uniref:Chitinase n=1 Tax=Methylomagnum ishizawai TaxID=1760988 RepID=A0A1Y6CW88_9GAMM|nr:glycosyl hydrolase [Methylomagnum ishizawai]SMF94929.1 hypothetical protein SAMN02949497_2268 [Methylomagnum ishizawai]